MGNGVTVPTSLWKMSRWMVIVMVVAEGFVPKYKVQYLYPSNRVIHGGSWLQQGHGHGQVRVRVRVQVSNEEGGGGKERDTTSRPRRMPRDDRRRRSRPSTPSLPEAEPRRRRRRAPHQFDHTQEEARPLLMDPVSVVRSQPDNEDAPAYDLSLSLSSSDSWTTEVAGTDGPPPRSHWETRSLNDLFPGRLDGLSERFASSHEFRTALRAAIREDVFDTTPAYANLSAKARTVLLLPDSSLQGSWKCRGGRWQRHQHPSNDDDNNDHNNQDNNGDGDGLRMVRLTRVLREALGPEAPNGDEFMDTIGSLCSFTVDDDGNDDVDDDEIDEDPSSTHWIDIVGVSKRRVPHSWHQDTGRAGASLSTEGSRRRRRRQRRTVLWGFPAENDYDGVGVFSHVVKLARERWAHEDHPLEKPVVYTPTSTSTSTTMDDRYIVRPRFAPGRELLLFRDVDVLHSAPDVIYRTSLMRFM